VDAFTYFVKVAKFAMLAKMDWGYA